MVGTLIVVGTPIGNLGDLSDRARSTLASAGVIAAEDTRRTGAMLARLGIERSGRLVSFYEENEADRVPELIALLRAGADVALASDAGMPGVSDPGYRLVAACVAIGVPVDVVPGPSAALAALVISGLPTDRFAFEGFLPRSGRARAERLSAVVTERRTVVMFESPRRVAKTLADLVGAGASGDRRAVVARELTKLHQEVLRGGLAQLAGDLQSRDLKGEVVIVVDGAPPEAAGGLDEAVAIARAACRGGARKREAARMAAARTSLPAALIYDALVRDER